MSHLDSSRAARIARMRERRAAASNVPGFPELVNTYVQCRLCGMAESHPDLLREIHTKYAAGKGVRRLETEMAPALDALGLEVLTVKCYARHFEGHVQLEVTTILADEDEDWLLLPPPPALEEDEEADEDEDREFEEDEIAPAEPLRLNEDDVEAAAYFDMARLITKLREKMDELDQPDRLPWIASNEEGQAGLNVRGYELYLKFATTFKGCLEGINRIKNSNRLMKAILQTSFKRHYGFVSAPLTQKIDDVLKLARANPAVRTHAPELLRALEQLAKDDVRGILEVAARETLKESCDLYKLH